jgi:hypothetical protein
MWRESPFTVGQKYLILADINFLNHQFKKGDHVVFRKCAYDPKGAVTRYSFENTETRDISSWHVFDGDIDPVETWTNYFQLI